MQQISNRLLTWYHQNQRELPWRLTKDPYAIMVSEIMLQQTRVSTVIDYYHRFMKAFPTVESLASAKEDEVLNLWKGLGYYSRARNLRKAALTITNELDGIFPDNITEVRKLPGIGDYTAGAIISIAFNKPHAAVDGNVLRVISRIFGIREDITLTKTKKEVTVRVTDMMPSHHAGDFTQTLMELGATLCTPQSPFCSDCPIADDCFAYKNKLTAVLPVKKKKEKPKMKKFLALLCIYDGKILMTRKREETLLKDMWGVPLLDRCQDNHIIDNVLTLTGVQPESFRKVGKVRHVFTHRIWEMEVVLCPVSTGETTHPDFRWFHVDELKNLPIPTAFAKVLQCTGAADDVPWR